MRPVVRIDKLVLKGFHSEDRDALAAALRGELRRQFSKRVSATDPVSRDTVSRLAIGNVPVGSRAERSHIGAQVAKRIVQGIAS